MRKIGETPYLSTLALTHPLRSGAIASDFQLVPASLTELSAQLVRGELAAGPISVIEYVRHRDRFDLVSNLAVSSWGRAACGLLFSKDPIGHPAGHTIAIPSRTAGTAYLLRSLMSDMYGVEPSFVERTGALDTLLQEHGAALLFEDDALVASQRVPAGVEVWDLGDAWWQFTNTPLIYMLWVTQKGLSDQSKQEIASALHQAKAMVVAVRPQLVIQAAARYELSESVIENFLGRFNYDFTSAHAQSLELLGATMLRLEKTAPLPPLR